MSKNSPISDYAWELIERIDVADITTKDSEEAKKELIAYIEKLEKRMT